MHFLSILQEAVLGIKAETVTAATAVIGLIGVAIEYRRQGRKAQLELAQEQIERIQTEEMIVFAVTALDWGTGKIPVPSAWREIVKSPSVDCNPLELVAAVTRKIDPQTAVNPIRLLYRHSFVALFNHLERIEDLRSAGVLNAKDLQPIVWIANQLHEWEYNPLPGTSPFEGALNG